MKKKAKKITSVVLVLAVMLGAFATIFSLSTSAAVSKAGTYDWYDENEEHYIYYFAMPENWDDIKYGKGLYGGAGIYWDEGTGACGPDAEGPNWPGYSTITEKYWVAMTDPKQRRPHDRDLYYSFVPKDVPSIIWNNYLDGSEITDVPASSFVFKTPRISVGANGYHEGDCSYYDSLDGFWDFVNDAWENNKDLLGRNAECFEEGSNGLTMTFNHMVYVIQEDITPDGGNSQIFKGEWYFCMVTTIMVLGLQQKWLKNKQLRVTAYTRIFTKPFIILIQKIRQTNLQPSLQWLPLQSQPYNPTQMKLNLRKKLLNLP